LYCDWPKKPGRFFKRPKFINKLKIKRPKSHIAESEPKGRSEPSLVRFGSHWHF
jgi:hypothetical protein